MIPLPPKRFQQIDNPLYDAIRFRPWFKRLERRRAKLPFLKEAYRQWIVCGLPQKQAAEACGVDERELRDYLAFVEKMWTAAPKLDQCILDDARDHYEDSRAAKSITYYIDRVAPRYGANSRHVIERWEVDPLFYPTGYNLS